MRCALLLFLSAALASAASLPVAFEPNRGQEPGPAEFLAHTSGAALTLRAGLAEWISREARVAVVFESARRGVQGQGEDALPGVVNYLIGNQPSRWRKNIPTYSRVRYRQLYPGVDVVYEVNDGRLEYDVVLARGADPNRIRLRVEGAQGLRVDDAGDLVIATAGGELRQHRPIVYQESNGQRRQIARRYLLRGREVRFALGRYDRSQPLVIDPALTWATYLLPSSNGVTTRDVQTLAVALDSAGNIYLAGSVFSSVGYNECFIAKLNPSGTANSVTFIGGESGSSDATAIAVSSAGNIYLAGGTASGTFPASSYYLNEDVHPGETVDGFVMELNNAATPVFSYYFGGSGTDAFYGLAVDPAGNVYLVGNTNSLDLPVFSTSAAGPAQTYLGGTGARNAFVVEFSSAGALVYSTYLGGSVADEGFAIAVDADGNAYVTGAAESSDFPVAGSNPFQSKLKGVQNAFVAKIAPNSGALVYSTYLGGSVYDMGNGIAVDSSGTTYITGETNSFNFPVTPGAYQTTYGSTQDGTNAFVTRLDGSGSSLLYSTYLGGSSGDSANAVAIDSAGNAYITGDATSTNFPISDAFQSTKRAPSGVANAFVAGLNASGSGLLFSSYLGGNAAATVLGGTVNYGDSGLALALNCAAGLVVAGLTDSTNFPTTSGTVTPKYPGGAPDAFVAQIGAGSVPDNITPGGIVNNANFASGAVAPGSIVSIFGSGLAPSTQLFSGFPLTTSLGGVTVSVNGVNAPIFYASPSQINIQVPFETVPGSAMIAVNSSCGSSGQVQVQVAQAAPYILQTVTGQGEAQAIVQNYNASTGQYTLNGPDNPAKVGSLVVAYLIGIGPVSNPPADGAAAPTTSVSPSTLTYSSTIGGWTTPLNNYPFLGLAPGWVGLDQANLTVPVGLSTGQYSVVITVGGVSSQTTPAPTMFVTE
jgi:uncharacterized protein (TIGR03437 family)